MINSSLPRIAGLVLGLSVMMAMPAGADALRDQIAPTGKLRVAIAISQAGGAFWSRRAEGEGGGYTGVPVALGRAMAAQLGVPVDMSRTRIPARSSMPRRAPGTSPSCRRTRSGKARCRSADL